MLCVGRGKLLLELLTTRDRLTLVRSPGTNAALAWSRGKIGGRLLGARLDDRALDANLALKRLPPKHEGHARVSRDLQAFTTQPVGVEDKRSVVVDLFEQHHAGRRRTIGTNGCKCHGVRLEDCPRPTGRPNPRHEEIDWIIAGGRLGQLAVAVGNSHLMKRHCRPPLRRGIALPLSL